MLVRAVRPTGIIPAYAGSTVTAVFRRRPTWDHPRIRGEHTLPVPYLIPRPGSSPHTRGARRRRRARPSAGRIIPAYAGSTGSSRMISMQSPDHPRIRGEHNLVEDAWVPVRGSSPHTRGAHTPEPFFATNLGIIPAYAGSTWHASNRPVMAPDHPRIRGEHAERGRHFRRLLGSSPHTRGAPTKTGTRRR